MMTTETLNGRTVRELLPSVLEAAVTMTGADFGNIQLVDPASGGLRIVTQTGFGSEFLDYFAVVDDDHSACGRAARDGAQTVIADVTTDPDFAPHREIAEATGFRAVVSTPLMDADGLLIGMVSTHFREPGLPSSGDLRAFALYGRLAGESIARQLREPSGNGDGAASADGAATTVDAAHADHAMNRAFAAGLKLAGARALIGPGHAGDLVAKAVGDLDQVIRDLRFLMYDPHR